MSLVPLTHSSTQGLINFEIKHLPVGKRILVMKSIGSSPISASKEEKSPPKPAFIVLVPSNVSPIGKRTTLVMGAAICQVGPASNYADKGTDKMNMPFLFRRKSVNFDN